jgi:hypothetical protein
MIVLGMLALALAADSILPPTAAYVRPQELRALPPAVRLALTARGCLVPRTVIGTSRSPTIVRPPAIVKGAFYTAGPQVDWAVYCSRASGPSELADDGQTSMLRNGRVSTLLVFRAARGYAVDSVTAVEPAADVITNADEEGSGPAPGLSVVTAYLHRTWPHDLDALWKSCTKDSPPPLANDERRTPRHDGILKDYNDANPTTIYWTGSRWIAYAAPECGEGSE